MKRFFLLLLLSLNAVAKSDSLKIQSNVYLETYYLNSSNGVKSPIFYNHTTVNSPAINLGMIEFFASKKQLSFHSGIMIGTYSQKNLFSEPDFWKNVYQLNLQFQFDSKSQLMAGIFPSHIGLESVKNFENDCFSRSYLAENSPYYETGLSWNYNASSNLSFRVLVLTGWQTIAKFNPSLGAQLVYLGKSGWKFNSSQFLGDEGKGTRFFINNFAQIPISKQLSGTVGIDLGVESATMWHGGLFILSWKPDSKIRISGRAEYFSDKNAVVLPMSFTDTSKSLSFDYSINKFFMLRSELKNSNKFGDEFMLGGLLLISLL